MGFDAEKSGSALVKVDETRGGVPVPGAQLRRLQGLRETPIGEALRGERAGNDSSLAGEGVGELRVSECDRELRRDKRNQQFRFRGKNIRIGVCIEEKPGRLGGSARQREGQQRDHDGAANDKGTRQQTGEKTGEVGAGGDPSLEFRDWGFVRLFPTLVSRTLESGYAVCGGHKPGHLNQLGMSTIDPDDGVQASPEGGAGQLKASIKSRLYEHLRAAVCRDMLIQPGKQTQS